MASFVSGTSSTDKKAFAMLEAAETGQLEVLRGIVEGGGYANINCRHPKTENTPLHRACARGFLLTVQYLIGEGANKNALDKWGDTPLHKAAHGGHEAVLEYLITKARVDWNAVNEDGQTAADLAKAKIKKKISDWIRLAEDEVFDDEPVSPRSPTKSTAPPADSYGSRTSTPTMRRSRSRDGEGGGLARVATEEQKRASLNGLAPPPTAGVKVRQKRALSASRRVASSNTADMQAAAARVNAYNAPQQPVAEPAQPAAPVGGGDPQRVSAEWSTSTGETPRFTEPSLIDLSPAPAVSLDPFDPNRTSQPTGTSQFLAVNNGPPRPASMSSAMPGGMNNVLNDDAFFAAALSGGGSAPVTPARTTPRNSGDLLQL